MNLQIRQMTLKDVLPLTKMYMSFSEKDREFFHPFPYKMWKLILILLYLAISNKITKRFRRLFPKLAFLSLVTVNAQKQITGFAYLRFLSNLPNNSYTARLGIIIHEGYRNLGIGSKLMDELIGIAKNNNIRKIILAVIVENEYAIHLYQKYGFEIKNVAKNRDFWNGKIYSDCDMELTLDIKKDANMPIVGVKRG